MKTTNLKLALAAATSAVVMLSGVTASNASEPRRGLPVQLDAQRPTAQTDSTIETDGMYLVRLAEPAIATYEGGINDFKATSARATGEKRLNTKSSAAKKIQETSTKTTIQGA